MKKNIYMYMYIYIGKGIQISGFTVEPVTQKGLIVRPPVAAAPFLAYHICARVITRFCTYKYENVEWFYGIIKC